MLFEQSVDAAALQLAEQATDPAGQRRDHRRRQTQACFAVGGRLRTVARQARHDPLNNGVVDHLLATPVCRQRLRHEQCQRFGRREHPIAVRRQQVLHLVQQPRAGQHIENIAHLRLLSAGEDKALLPCGVRLTTVHVGRLLDGGIGFVTFTLPSFAGLLFLFQPVADCTSLKLVPFCSVPGFYPARALRVRTSQPGICSLTWVVAKVTYTFSETSQTRPEPEG